MSDSAALLWFGQSSGATLFAPCLCYPRQPFPGNSPDPLLSSKAHVLADKPIRLDETSIEIVHPLVKTQMGMARCLPRRYPQARTIATQHRTPTCDANHQCSAQCFC